MRITKTERQFICWIFHSIPKSIQRLSSIIFKDNKYTSTFNILLNRSSNPINNRYYAGVVVIVLPSHACHLDQSAADEEQKMNIKTFPGGINTIRKTF